MTSHFRTRVIKSFLAGYLLFNVTFAAIAQETTAGHSSVQTALQAKYSLVQFHKECGGWYFLSYQKDGQTLYGFADKAGNIVASDAYKYVLHKGFIELYLLDMQKKSLHDQWKIDIAQYQRDLNNYKSIKAKYEAEVNAYNAKREQAREEAERRYKREVKLAQERAEYENQKNAQQYSNSGTAGAILGAISAITNTISSNVSVKFEPIFNQVLAERNLLVKPSEPYNPRPTEPTEPSTGYYWTKYPLRQPVNYTYVDYDKIKEGVGFANVKEGSKYGLVDAEFNVIVPCSASKEILKQSYSNNQYLIDVNGIYSIIDGNANKIITDAESIDIINGNYLVMRDKKCGIFTFAGKEIVPCRYERITFSEGHYLCRENGKWGVFTSDFKQLYAFKYQDLKLLVLEGKKFLLTKLNGAWGATEFSTGRDLIPNIYADIKYNTNNSYLTVVKSNGKRGVYMTNGRMLIPSEFDDITINSSSGEIQVKQGKTVGLYDAYGLSIVPPGKYNSYIPSNILNNLTAYTVTKDGLTGVITPYGTEVIPCRYTTLSYVSSLSVYYASIGNKIGILACDGSTVVPFMENISLDLTLSNLKYREKPYILLEGYVKNKYKYGVADYAGNIILPLNKGKGKPISAEKEAIKAIRKNLCDTDAAEKAFATIDEAKRAVNNIYTANVKKYATFTTFAQNYVENVINDWQKKGEFEKTEDYHKRVNVSSRQAKVLQLTTEAKDAFIAIRSKSLASDKLKIIGNYDPDNETFRISTLYAKDDLLVHVPSESAQAFKSSFATCKSYPQFFIENDDISLSGYTFVVDGKTYSYNSKNELIYQVPEVEYSFDAIQIDKSSANMVGGGKKQKFSTTQFITKSSDVDVNIPVTTTEQKNTFAVIIANENYDNEQNVPFAYHDGTIFQEYCLKTLGIPKQNIRFGSDLTSNQMRNHVNWMRETAQAFGGNARFIVYYVGHGMPDDKTKDAYLLPSDGNALDPTTGYRLADLYATLGDMPAENVLVLLDACFSGAQRNGSMMQKGARGVVLAAKQNRPTGNVVVMSAASSKETAWPYLDKSHGLFTYFILKKLQESKGNAVSMGEMFDFVKTQVSQHSIVTNNKMQTPTVNPSTAIISTWKNQKI